MMRFEDDYMRLIRKIKKEGVVKKTRNGSTQSLFGEQIKVHMSDGFPLIQGRKMYPAGILGEFAAMIRGPKCVEDFERWGCNYWGLWADKKGKLELDYGNAWLADGQLDNVIDKLKNNPNDRRIMITGWNPSRLKKLSLPCCHYAYQWYVRDGVLDMVWIQRSVDMMIGLPSDFVLGAVWLIGLANQVGLTPGSITFQLGDCHIYEEHNNAADDYLKRFYTMMGLPAPSYALTVPPGMPITQMRPDWFEFDYVSKDPIKLLLKE